MRRRIARGLLTAAAVIAIAGTAGCGNFRESLGLNKNPPDEFRVVSREPLTVPPDFELRAPEAGGEQTTRRSAREQAEQTVFTGEDAPANDGFDGANGMSRGETALLAQAGAQNVDPDIRRTIARETDRLEQAERSFVNRLIFWQEPDETAKVVDADKEAKRLRENAALGKGLTDGETPTIERKERGLLEGLFN
jgi:hypothetical protein